VKIANHWSRHVGGTLGRGPVGNRRTAALPSPSGELIWIIVHTSIENLLQLNGVWTTLIVCYRNCRPARLLRPRASYFQEESPRRLETPVNTPHLFAG